MIIEPRTLLQAVLSQSNGFQTLTSTVGHPEMAIQRVHIDAVTPGPKNGGNYTLKELQGLRPYALIYYGEEAFQWQRDAMGDFGSDCDFGQISGQIMCEIYRDTPAGDAAAVAISFMTLLDEIARDVIGMSETAGGLFITRFSFRGPFRTEEEEYSAFGDSQGALMTFDFGNAQV